jgi:hypothetical protein
VTDGVDDAALYTVSTAVLHAALPPAAHFEVYASFIVDADVPEDLLDDMINRSLDGFWEHHAPTHARRRPDLPVLQFGPVRFRAEDWPAVAARVGHPALRFRPWPLPGTATLVLTALYHLHEQPEDPLLAAAARHGAEEVERWLARQPPP